MDKIDFLGCCDPEVAALGVDYQSYEYSQQVRGWSREFTEADGWARHPDFDSDYELGTHAWLEQSGAAGFNSTYTFVAGAVPVLTVNPDLDPAPDPSYVDVANPLNGSVIFPAMESFFAGVLSADFTAGVVGSSTYAHRALPTAHTLDLRMDYVLIEFRFSLPEEIEGEWLEVVYRADFDPADGSAIVEGAEVTETYTFTAGDSMEGGWLRLPVADYTGEYFLTVLKYRYFHSSPWILV